MFGFVNWLKAIAAVFITNSHYADIWPISSLAMGGHLGNCLYFFLSGFCLFNIKEAFPKWYLKRIIRIYPTLWIVNSIDLIAGRTSITEFMGFVHCFFYPTWFHFIGSIMILYAVYYIVRYIQKKLKLDMRWIMVAIMIVFFVSYLLFFEKSTYHIDDVNENWVRFMFFESMLMGAWFRENYERIGNNITVANYVLFGSFTIVYFLGKLLISRVIELSVIQCFLPVVLLIYIYSIAMIFVKLEKNNILEMIGRKANNFVGFISKITLEIYLGQFLVFWVFNGLEFPISFIVVTAAIILYAWIIHSGAEFIRKKVIELLEK